jgi:hypothetical protein
MCRCRRSPTSWLAGCLVVNRKQPHQPLHALPRQHQLDLVPPRISSDPNSPRLLIRCWKSSIDSPGRARGKEMATAGWPKLEVDVAEVG